jgi:hypothetical protein
VLLAAAGGEASSGSGSDDEQQRGTSPAAAAAAGNGNAAAPGAQREDWMTVPMASSALFKQPAQEAKPAQVSTMILLCSALRSNRLLQTPDF